MTNEKAINKLKDAIARAEYIDETYVDSVDIEAIKMAVKALEKQIPTKDIASGIYATAWLTTGGWTCSHCGNTATLFDRPSFCPRCGVSFKF